MKVWIALLVLASSATWITAIVQWFQHDDHAAIGWAGVSLVVGNYANYMIKRYLAKRRLSW